MKMEIWIIYRRIGTWIVPDIWDVAIPKPYQFMENWIPSHSQPEVKG